MRKDQKLRLLVVIINYKTPDLVIGALRSLESELDPQSDRVVVVDNFSEDDSVKKIETTISENSWNTWTEQIQSPLNGGFSAGNNIGIKAYKADYYLLLNSDAYLHKNAITEMLTTFSKNENIGIVGPRIEWEDGDAQVSCFNDLTPVGEFVRTANTGIISRLFKKIGINEIAISKPNDNLCPQWVSFACVMINRKLIDQIGLMDENYFMYREDNDYCRRARQNKWKIAYSPLARVVHLNQGLSNKKYQRMPDFYHRSRSYYFIKFYGRLGLLAANICWCIGRMFSKMREMVSDKQANVHKKAYLDIWKGFWQ